MSYNSPEKLVRDICGTIKDLVIHETEKELERLKKQYKESPDIAKYSKNIYKEIKNYLDKILFNFDNSKDIEKQYIKAIADIFNYSNPALGIYSEEYIELKNKFFDMFLLGSWYKKNYDYFVKKNEDEFIKIIDKSNILKIVEGKTEKQKKQIIESFASVIIKSKVELKYISYLKVVDFLEDKTEEQKQQYILELNYKSIKCLDTIFVMDDFVINTNRNVFNMYNAPDFFRLQGLDFKKNSGVSHLY